MANTNKTEGFPDELGAIWVKTAKTDGKQFLSISIKGDIKAGTQLVAFKNKNKTQPNHPDFRIQESRPYEGGTTSAPAASRAPAVAAPDLAI